MSTETVNSTTDEIRAALRHADAFLNEHGLHASRVEVSASRPGWRRNPVTEEYDLPVLPTIHVFVARDWERRDSTEFVRWCRAVGAITADVHRRDDDTTLSAWADLVGYTWRLHGSVSRPESGPHLPGIEVEWEVSRKTGRAGKHGWVAVEDLEIALRRLVRDGKGAS